MVSPDKVPRCMSTQHPDNVQTPFFADHPLLQGEDEVKEAFYAYSHLGCTEQMWDYEGKEVDPFVVKKLLTRYEAFFREHRLGVELFLTLRVPNPRVERAEGKVLLETLESIPRSCDAARLFYGKDAPPPIFEVILPMTTSAAELDRVYHYYREFIGGKGRQRCFDITVADWVGDFSPEVIQVIPLIEDRDHLLRADGIVAEYLRGKEVPYQRVFLARSDPALNYGQASAVLLVKVALMRLERLERRMGIPILPILGVGSAPFRGNFSPPKAAEMVREYPSVQTYTVQSAFKYDYPEGEAREAISRLTATPRGVALEVDEGRCLDLIRKISARYAACVAVLAPVVNEVARYVPARRARKLHIGLFGYSRELDGHDVRLPRAITFCCAMYSLGIPPEVLGLGTLSREDLAALREAYVNFDQDMRDAMRYLNPEVLERLSSPVRDELERAMDLFPLEPDEEHAERTSRIWALLQEGERNRSLVVEELIKAAARRRFLG